MRDSLRNEPALFVVLAFLLVFGLPPIFRLVLAWWNYWLL